jgi:peptidoglycan hydrolase CwlO-like protein
MDILGKIFVFAIFIMSLVFMSFSVAIYATHTNWREEITRTAAEAGPGKPVGYQTQLKQAKEERDRLTTQINDLVRKVSESELVRDQVIAQVQSALKEKNEELSKLQSTEAENEKNLQEATKKRDESVQQLTKLSGEVEELRNRIQEEQSKVDAAVKRSASLADELHQKQAFLQIADERRKQLEEQVANARELLKAAGLDLGAVPADQLPELEGSVSAVGQDMVEISLGGHDGLRKNIDLEVYRDTEYVGRVRVIDVMPDKAFARPIKDYMKDAIRRGDRVATRLKA